MHDVFGHTHTHTLVCYKEIAQMITESEHYKIHRCEAENSRMLVVNRMCSSSQVQMTEKKK